MSANEATEINQSRISQQTIAKQFVRLYYGVLNTHHEYLYQFYGKNSTVTISESMEGGETVVEAAEEETAIKELLNMLYSDVRIRVHSAVPQFSVDDSVLLHVNGIMERKSTENRRTFAQVFVLFPQENGYYIRTDITHVMGTSAINAASRAGSPLEGVSENGSVIFRLGSYNGELPDVTALKCTPSVELRTKTPPLEDAPRTQTKLQESDHESEEHLPQSSEKKSKSWIMRPPLASSSVSHAILPPPPPPQPLPVQGTMPMPPMPLPHGMVYPMPMPPAPSRYLHQRSASMGCDPWGVQRVGGHGVFIARLPFGIQPVDVEQAFAPFGMIQGGRDGIQVRDGRNGCYAFVTFENHESAQAAIQQGAIIQGKRVFVEPRYPRQEIDAQFVAFSHMVPPGPMPTYHHQHHMTQGPSAATANQIPRMPR
eukprot:g5198.t1